MGRHTAVHRRPVPPLAVMDLKVLLLMATVAGFATALPADFTKIANNQVDGALLKIAANAVPVQDGVLPVLDSVETNGNTFHMYFSYPGTGYGAMPTLPRRARPGGMAASCEIAASIS